MPPTSTSRGRRPTFSITQLPSKSYPASSGAVTRPPSMSRGYPPMPTHPPHLLVPTSRPILACLKSHGSPSPPEPDIWFAIITFGPKIPFGAGVSSPSRRLFIMAAVQPSAFTM